MESCQSKDHNSLYDWCSMTPWMPLTVSTAICQPSYRLVLWCGWTNTTHNIVKNNAYVCTVSFTTQSGCSDKLLYRRSTSNTVQKSNTKQKQNNFKVKCFHFRVQLTLTKENSLEFEKVIRGPVLWQVIPLFWYFVHVFSLIISNLWNQK